MIKKLYILTLIFPFLIVRTRKREMYKYRKQIDKRRADMHSCRLFNGWTWQHVPIHPSS